MGLVLGRGRDLGPHRFRGIRGLPDLALATARVLVLKRATHGDTIGNREPERRATEAQLGLVFEVRTRRPVISKLRVRISCSMAHSKPGKPPFNLPTHLTDGFATAPACWEPARASVIVESIFLDTNLLFGAGCL